ncbi:hypothetical protein D3C71_1199570 [compost metagenome]
MYDNYYMVVGTSGSSLRLRSSFVRGVALTLLLGSVIVALFMHSLITSIEEKTTTIQSLNQSITSEKATVETLKTQQQKFETYISDIELELEDIKENFETYKKEVEKNV